MNWEKEIIKLIRADEYDHEGEEIGHNETTLMVCNFIREHFTLDSCLERKAGRNEILEILNKYQSKIPPLHNEGSIDPMDFHKIADEIIDNLAGVNFPR